MLTLVSMTWQREDKLRRERQEARALKKQQEKEAKQLLHEQLYGQYNYPVPDVSTAIILLVYIVMSSLHHCWCCVVCVSSVHT